MLLRRLELFGFKSFANRTKLEFGPGITALVGPNGSGKSNIADAIRWALGEQRLRLLRCEKNDDLIHINPGQFRNPGFCEAVLLLDNSSGILPLDYSEVEVSRRVYRSGESEFMLNRTRCRLKDIQELFLDTGLGRDTYALINQGQVENLLTMRAEERRLMLEEAAGILKYRYRKGEVLNKLTESELNIRRLNDLLVELNHQLSILEKEAIEEKNYRQCRQELEASQITLALHEINSWQKEREKVLQKIQGENCRQQSIETRLQTLEARIEEEKLALHFKEEKLSKERQNLAICRTNLGRLEESIAWREERNQTLLGEIERKEQQQKIRADKITEIKSAQKETEIMIDLLHRQRAGLEKELKSLAGAGKQYQEKWREKEIRFDADRDQAFEILRRQSEGKNEWQLLNARRESIKHSISQGQQQLGDIEGELLALRSQNAFLVQEKIEWGNNLIKADKALTSLKREINIIQVREEDIQGTWRQKQGQLEQARARLHFLQELESSYGGYHRGVQAILKNFSRGIYGTVADLIQVDENLEGAIAVALGSALQFLVAKNDDIAQDAIEYLVDNKLGRATFLPLNTIQGKNLSGHGQALLTLPGVLGRAADLAKADPPFCPVVEFLLGQVIVVKDLFHARMVAKKGNYRFNIVSLRGEFITPGGAFTGGTLGQGQIQLLSRKREIQELLERHKVLNSEVQLLETDLTSIRGIRTATMADIDRAQDERKQAEMRLREIEREGKKLNQNLKKGGKVLDALGWEQKSAEEELRELDKNMGLLEQRLSQLEKEDGEVQERLRGAEDILKEYRRMQEYHQNKITNLRVDNAGLIQQLQSQGDYLGKIKEQYSEAREALLEEEKEINILKKEEGNIRLQLELEYNTRAVEKHREAELRQRIEVLRVEKEEGQRNLSMLQEESRVLRDNIIQVIERTHQWEKNLTKLETSLTEVKRRLFADYKLSPAQAEKYKSEILSISGWHQRVTELQKEMAQCNDVNLRAGEQHQELRGRFDFLTQQREDLVTARKTLSELLEEIDAVSKERLQKTFIKVQKSFQKVFRELFEGGKTRLSFTDSKNPLEGGLEIMVQLPGKKLQNILLLSGGEKALAAIAFLFGILRVKPSPFCVLDEIDASLDDVNAVRLGNFLRRHGDQIQFLLITHRQEIIKQADILYGIATDEYGVSQILSLDMENDMVG